MKLPQNWGVMWLFWVTSRGPIGYPPLKKAKFSSISQKFPPDANLGKGEGDKEKVGIDYKGLPADVVPGDILLLDDGRVQLKVLEVQGMKVFTEVTVGGPLSNNKGINKLGGGLSAEALTETKQTLRLRR